MSVERHPRDFYETPPWCVRRFVENPIVRRRFLCEGSYPEPAAGSGALARKVDLLPLDSWDLVDIEPRGGRVRKADGLSLMRTSPIAWDVVWTNPPFTKALEFARAGLAAMRKVLILLLPLNWLSSVTRNEFLTENPPTGLFPLPNRPNGVRLVRVAASTRKPGYAGARNYAGEHTEKARDGVGRTKVMMYENRTPGAVRRWWLARSLEDHSIENLAEVMGWPVSKIEALIKGDLEMTDPVKHAIAHALGLPANKWDSIQRTIHERSDHR